MTTAAQIRRNTVLLALCLVTLSGVLQLATAVATITLVLVTGVESILGLGPAIFLSAGAIAALPAGRLMDRYGRVPIISGGFDPKSLTSYPRAVAQKFEMATAYRQSKVVSRILAAMACSARQPAHRTGYCSGSLAAPWLRSRVRTASRPPAG